MPDTIIPWPQFETAHKLALAYGHEWAHAWHAALCAAWVPAMHGHTDEGMAAGGVPLSLIQQTTTGQQGDFPMPLGIEVPDVNAAGHVVHVTGTGRLHWWVLSGGSVTLEIHRPGLGGVMEAVVPAAPARDLWAEVAVRVSCPGAIHRRHVTAMASALLPLVGLGATLFALADVATQAVPDGDGYVPESCR